MGLFSHLENFAAKQAMDIIKNFRRGRADITMVKDAYKMLAGGKKLYKIDSTYDSDRADRYYWVVGNHLENIDGDYDDIQSIDDDYCKGYSNKYVRVRSSECSYIDFSGY